jgi:hypothetical protein
MKQFSNIEINYLENSMIYGIRYRMCVSVSSANLLGKFFALINIK